MRNRPLKVLFLASSYPRSADDTASVFLRYLAEHLAEDGIDVHVLAPADGKSESVVEGKITVHRFQYFPAALQNLAYGSGMLPNLKRSPWLWIQVPCFLFAMTISLLRLLARQRFDVIHAHWILPQGLVGLVGTGLFRVPLLTSAHGTDAFVLNGLFANMLKRIVLRRSRDWTANTKSTAAAVRLFHSPEPRIIPMGVDVGLFSSGNAAELQAYDPQEKYLLLFVGRLIENKGCHDLLKAVALLPADIRTQTSLWIVGDGVQRNQLEHAAKDLGLAEKVHFFGAVSHRRLPDFYAAADLVVVPSKIGSSGETEGQSVVVLEAFAARACVLATSIGGIGSMVRDNETGLLVEPGNPKSLACGIERLLNDPSLRQNLSTKALAEVNAGYSWIDVARKFAELYEEITATDGHA
jgi:glycosyltransferase involved in cell wall biosynthesis